MPRLQDAEVEPSLSQPPLLIIARAYPPVVGGMERFAFELVENLARVTPVRAITHGGSKKALPFFLPYATLKAIRLAATHRVRAVHLCDALLAPAGAAIKATTGIRVSVSVHGLDLTYPNPLYQAALKASLPRLDLVIAGSSASHDLALTRFPSLSGKVQTINYGVSPEAGRGTLSADVETLVAGRRVLLTVGRLIKRKGAAWFCEQVMPRLPAHVVYVLAGEGPEREAIEAAAVRAGVRERVLLRGRVSEDEVRAWYSRADAFVMPNVPVPGDVEGFGLVALEAAVQGLPVIASRLEGIPDAVRDGHNGVLVEPLNPAAFAEALAALLSMPAAERTALGGRCRRFTVENYSWERMAAEYAAALSGDAEQRRAVPEAEAA